MTTHAFNFTGGEFLTTMGATWFVSYSYYNYIDTNHTNWNCVNTYKNRMSVYAKTKQYHRFWLQQVLDMNPNQLNKNTLGLEAHEIKAMAKEILSAHKV